MGRLLQRRRILRRDGNSCFYCGTIFLRETEMTLDHVVPICLRPRGAPGGVVLACEPCNQSKGAMSPADVLALAGAPIPPGLDELEPERVHALFVASVRGRFEAGLRPRAR
ncbi:HNH endonuclease [Streptomyces caatingaensis]|uniref:HNH endonuclease n=1 Tax=Streptomyces caatingaensis TaxID=1678637 RepID=UPI0012FE9C81|nr:HNH endonuclease [Streptomyces caatingaensis]